MTVSDEPLKGLASGPGEDSALDSGTETDAGYLEKLGYTQELDRALGGFSSFAVQFSSIAIGTAMYTTVVVGLGFFGPASFWSYAIGGLLQVFVVGWAVAELVSAYPLSGGVYQIVNRVARKPLLAWQTGWWLVVAHTVSVTAIAVSLVPFLADWFGDDHVTAGQTTLWAIGLIVLVTLVNLAGVRIVALTNNIGVGAELVGLVLIVGALLLVKHDTQPLSVLTDSGGTADGGWLKPFMFAMILPAYLISSFDATGNAAEETKNAARVAPRATFIANISAYVAGLVFLFLLLRAIPSVNGVMASSVPAKYILTSAVGSTVTNIFEALAVVALIATMVVLQLTGIRVLWSQSRDGQMPAAGWVRKVSLRRVPVNATLVVLLMSLGFALWSSLLSVLAAMVALSWAMAYGVVVLVGFPAIVRKSLPQHPFSAGRLAPAVFGLAIVWSVILCALLVWGDPKHVGWGAVGMVAVGFVLYFLIPSERRGKIPGLTSR